MPTKICVSEHLWPIIRWFKSISNYPRSIKFFFQRGFRGYADCDCWSIDWHISKIIAPMLKQLRDNKRSLPSNLTEQEWDTILNNIIAGFEASQRIQNIDYESGDTEGMQRDMITFEKGMKLFHTFYFNLWD